MILGHLSGKINVANLARKYDTLFSSHDIIFVFNGIFAVVSDVTDFYHMVGHQQNDFIYS